MSNDHKLNDKKKVEIVDKLIKERDKLKIKIDKLDKWLNDPLEKPYLNNKQYIFCYCQFHILQSYRIILDLRIMDLQNERNKSK